MTLINSFGKNESTSSSGVGRFFKTIAKKMNLLSVGWVVQDFYQISNIWSGYNQSIKKAYLEIIIKKKKAICLKSQK